MQEVKKLKKLLNDFFPEWLTGKGFFTYLNQLSVPWSDSAQVLNVDYHGGYSGGKRASPLIMKLLDSDGDLTTTRMIELANIAASLFGIRWAKMWEQTELQYNPIHNYDMTESEIISGSHSGSDAHTGTDTRTLSSRKGENGNSSTEFETTRSNTDSNTNVTDSSIGSTDSVFAFNSSEWENNRKNVTENGTTITDNRTAQQTGTDTTSETHTNTIEDSGTDALQHGETITTSRTNSENRTLTRSGNIGVTTTAQMLEQERNLWKWNFFRDVVYKDIDSLLTLQIY